MADGAYRILIVEDVLRKYTDVLSVLESAVAGASLHVQRAENLNAAEDMISEEVWSLLLLDLSMDISESESIDTSSGHATLGGLDILERMALLKIVIPTILVTGFDSFQDSDRFQNSITYLPDIERLAKQWLGAAYRGYVRYGSSKWDSRLRTLIMKWNQS
nr:hypothetical protein [Sphingomonas melonis]